MKHKISLFGLIILMAFVIIGCSKNQQITLGDSLDLAVEEIFADDLYEDVFSGMLNERPYVFRIAEYAAAF